VRVPKAIAPVFLKSSSVNERNVFLHFFTSSEISSGAVLITGSAPKPSSSAKHS